MDKLKPCPFCGGEAEYFEERIFVSPLRNVSWKGVKCKRCGGSYIDANLNTSPNDMIKAWNRRAAQTVVNQMGNNPVNINGSVCTFNL